MLLCSLHNICSVIPRGPKRAAATHHGAWSRAPPKCAVACPWGRLAAPRRQPLARAACSAAAHPACHYQRTSEDATGNRQKKWCLCLRKRGQGWASPRPPAALEGLLEGMQGAHLALSVLHDIFRSLRGASSPPDAPVGVQGNERWPLPSCSLLSHPTAYGSVSRDQFCRAWGRLSLGQTALTWMARCSRNAV